MTQSLPALSSRGRLTAALLFAAALAGCQAPASSGPPPPPAFAAPSFGAPAFGSTQAPAASPTQRTATLSSSTKSWETPDGTRHTKSSSTTASMRVDPNAMGNAAAMLFGAMMGQSTAAAPAPVSKGQIAGDWNVDVDGRQCRLSLRPTGAGMGDFASTFGCIGTELQSVTSWSLRGNEVVLNGMMSKRVAVLRLSGTNRMDGPLDGSSGKVVAWR
ncbi:MULTISPECIES: AprI/Inh family metalloprotease inhibitor [unclassified Stappia]|uniref:AprI/Inh family metalloprotease inhibitor n=1 Tax=unclassified Stappia TaxID=2629676 RepID=UPI0016439E98|nr:MULTISPECIES: AprI/Inh family metalloprotease inhibitor [unclassified Stappia]